MRTDLALLATAVVAAAASAGDPCPDLSGRWSGYWVSDTTGHTGPLRATFRPAPGGYRVTFTGRFWKVVPFVYTVTLNAAGVRGDAVILAGTTRAGPVIGEYRYDAVATATDFQANYTARNDHGRFVLTRRP